ncbi:transferase family-domain-containing protein [Aspergillus navahoensis]
MLNLDILETPPTLHRLYTQICSVYPVPEPSAHEHIAFPWLAGVVVNEGATEGVTGTFRITPTAEIPFVAKFPFTMLDESFIAPCMTVNPPGSSVGLIADTGPVFAVQVNFIRGGLILTFVGQHNVMDMAGQATIINWLSRACHNLPLSVEELSIGNMDKSKSSSQKATTTPWEGPSVSSWHSAATSQGLKSLATQTKDPRCGFISTDDAICAFIWKCVSRARVSRLKPETPSTFARAVDARQCLGISNKYPGVLSNMAYSKSSLELIIEEPLGIIASHLRRQLDPKVRDLAYDTRALATFLNRSVDVSSGMSLSSWAKVNLYDLDFNLGLGKPEVVRRPRFVPVESLIYMMPKSLNGALAVALCLRIEDWERLNADEEWKKYATYIGC